MNQENNTNISESKQSARERQLSGLRPFPKGVSGNPLGRPVGTVSLVTDIKNRLLYIKEKQPDKYQSIIDDYWMDKSKRELLIKIVEPQALSPQTQVNIDQRTINYSPEIIEEEAIEFLKQRGWLISK